MITQQTPSETTSAAPRRHAIVVLPAAASLPDLLAEHGRWMSRGHVLHLKTRTEPLATVLGELGYAMPVDGLAALRCWGQTGQRPDGWVCGADPVYFEAMLDHVRLHALDGDVLADDDRQQLFDLLQQQAGNERRKFCRIGEYGYLFGDPSIATATRSAALLDRAQPDDDLPTGAIAQEHDRLTGELQLMLHDAQINRHRDERGLPPVNSIWFWGGGFAPAPRSVPLPPLYGDDALFRGYWQSAGANIGSLPDQPDSLPATHVAIVTASAGTESAADRLFRILKRQLALGRIRRLTMVFADGWLLRLSRWQVLASWRGHDWPYWPGMS